MFSRNKFCALNVALRQSVKRLKADSSVNIAHSSDVLHWANGADRVQFVAILDYKQ